MSRSKNNNLKKPVYQFDIFGVLIKKYESIEDASLFLKIKHSTIRNAISRKSCVGGRCYFTYNENFKTPIKKSNFNPIYGKGINKGFGEGSNVVRLTTDFSDEPDDDDDD